ncbi:MAG: SPOR domain-containing protein, partial [bacterium]|nr:SPOR domain-containing protein [bacterium]
RNFRGAAIARSLADGWRLKSDSAQANFYWRQILELYPESYEAGEAREQLLSDIEDSPEAQEDSLPAPKAESPAIKSPPVKTAVPGPKPGNVQRYYLQVGLYRDRAVMADWKKRLEKQDHRCRVDSSGSKKDRSYRLFAGPYGGKDEALKASQKLLSAYGIKTMLVQK